MANLMTKLLRIADAIEFPILRIDFRTNAFCVTWYLAQLHQQFEDSLRLIVIERVVTQSHEMGG